jgi:hypothetical protein
MALIIKQQFGIRSFSSVEASIKGSARQNVIHVRQDLLGSCPLLGIDELTDRIGEFMRGDQLALGVHESPSSRRSSVKKSSRSYASLRLNSKNQASGRLFTEKGVAR